MGDKTKKWYVVKLHSNKHDAFLYDNKKVARNLAKSKGVKCVEFTNQEDAIKFAGCKLSRIHIAESQPTPPRICLICEKPFHGRTQLCPTCRKKQKELPLSISVRTLSAIKTQYPGQDTFSYISNNPGVVYKLVKTVPVKERAEMKRVRSEEFRSVEYRNTMYSKTDSTFPKYIRELFEKDLTKDLLYLEGNRLNPNVYYLCKRCGQEQCQTYDHLKKGLGHDCAASRSSGEAIVEEYLKVKKIPYRTQRDTLVCINPKTQRVMPYDFELAGIRVVLEVQGEQHFVYNPYFHGSVENYNYQQWKDNYKKEFAVKHGFRICYLTYEEINSGRYKEIIDGIVAAHHEASRH